jgi:hypothetical protein
MLSFFDRKNVKYLMICEERDHRVVGQEWTWGGRKSHLLSVLIGKVSKWIHRNNPQNIA